MSTKKPTSAQSPKNVSTFALLVCAFLIGGAAVYFALPLLYPEIARAGADRAAATKTDDHNHAATETCELDHDHSEHAATETCEFDHDHSQHAHSETEEHADHDHSEHVHSETEEHADHDHAEHAHSETEDHAGHDHAEHVHSEADEHAGHNHAEGEVNPDALALNRQALANIGIAPGDAGVLVLQPQNYRKTFSIPAFVRYKPGRSLADVPSPVSGIVTKIYAEEGDALCPGAPLFELQLAREEVAACQLELSSLLRKRDILNSEAQRLASLEAGIAPQAQREIALQQAENEAAIATQKETLRFHGVPLETIEETIIEKRALISTLTVRVPAFADDASGLEIETTTLHQAPDAEHFLQTPHFCQLEKILVEKGESVTLGSSLCVVSDLRSLLLEGRAFESDEARINGAFAQNRTVSAIFPDARDPEKREKIADLPLRSVSNRLDSASRTFACYVELSNYLLTDASGHEHAHENHDHSDHDHAEHAGHDHSDHDHAAHDGHDHADHNHAAHDGHDHADHVHAVLSPEIPTAETALAAEIPAEPKAAVPTAPRLNWRFKPGQRCELVFETETASNVFVVPVAATAQEGVETFLFEHIGEDEGNPIWLKRPVVVLWRTADEVVLANDGSVKIGARIARSGARQLYVALTNGGGKLQSACGHDHSQDGGHSH